MSSHPLIAEAAQAASRYRVKRAERGFAVWHFRGWSRNPCGWQVIVANVPSEADGWLHVLRALGLTTERPAECLPAPEVTWSAAEWL